MKFEIKHRFKEHKRYLIKNGFKNPKIASSLEFNYWVSECGALASAINPCLTLRKTPLILRKRKTTNGYLILRFKSRNILVHRIIAKEYIGDIENKVVHHKNGIRHDNRVENLEITTSRENNKDGSKTRKKMYGGFIKQCLELFKEQTK